VLAFPGCWTEYFLPLGWDVTQKQEGESAMADEARKSVTGEQYAAMVGQEIGVSDWVTISQEMINQFADVTGDHQFIHVNEELAKQTPFGTTIAHGFLSLSLLPMFGYSALPLQTDAKMGVNYGANKLRFIAPVKSGKRVRGRFKLLALDTSKPGQRMSTVEATVEIEGETKPALVAEWLTLVYY
jgi:acyl dehydratase